jgi:hypothetical protein
MTALPPEATDAILDRGRVTVLSRDMLALEGIPVPSPA